MSFASLINVLAPLMRTMLLASTIALLQACSGGSGGGESDRVGDTGSDNSLGFVYNGPVPANAEIQNFKTAFYDNVVIRCGSCHTRGGAGPTAFVDNDDVNYAWEQAQTVANLLDPAASEVVTRVNNGHNCWLNSNASCAAAMTSYVERWAAGASQSVSTVTLLPRSPQELDGFVTAPATYAAAQAEWGSDLSGAPELQNLLGMLRTYCSDCHSGSSATPQSPYFASNDMAVAYAAMLGKVDLSNPGNSRFVIRLENQHNCWSGATGCASDASEMEGAIAAFAGILDVVDEVDSDLIISMAQILEEDGIVASSGGRYETDVIAKWEFREGEGTQVADTSGVQPEIPLTLLGDYEWFGGWGVRLDEGRAQGAVSASTKLYDRLSASGEYTIEAWVAPNNVTQEDAWIFGYAAGPNNRNTLMTQTLYNYDFYNRSSTVPVSDGGPAASTDDDDEFAQATLQHVVLTYDPFNGRKIYVNGEDTGVIDEEGPGTLTNWSSNYAVVMGNDFAASATWQGVIRMMAVHSSAMTQGQIIQNYDIGVGQKYFLMFSLSSILDEPGNCHETIDGNRVEYCYVVFEVSQFDSTAYLFKDPRFVNINPSGGSSLSFNLRGIHIGINGQLARTGQGFVNVDANINGSTFTMEDAPLMQRGSIIPLENGPENDVFFLAFKEIDSNVAAEPNPTVPGSFSYEYPEDPDTDEADIVVGMRTFDEINESFSFVTRVPKDSSSVSAATGKTVSETFDTVRRSLPSVADFQTFMASHQMAIMQLAAAYCDAMVEDNTARTAMFAGVNVNSISNWDTEIIVPLIDRIYSYSDDSSHLESQPTRYDDGDSDGDDRLGTADRDDLILRLENMVAGFSGSVTDEQAVKATCTAVLSSAAATMK